MKNPENKLFSWYIVGALLLILFAALCSSGCQFMKTKSSARMDSTSVSKVDSTHLKKSDAGNKSDSSWWREIINYGRNGDTVINNTTVPVNNYYPTQIIREGGTFSKENYLRMVDSVNKAKADSATKNTVVESKDKKSGIDTTIAVFIGLGILVLFGAIGLVILYKLTKLLKK